MGRLLFVLCLLIGNHLTLSSHVFDRSRLPCQPDCVCLAGGGVDDVTRSRGAELCVRSAEVGLLSSSRLASVTRLSIVGRPSTASLAATARLLSNARRLQIISVADDDDLDADWMRFFSAFSRLHQLTIRNSSSPARALAAGLSVGRLLPKLRRLDLSGSGVSQVDLKSVWTLHGLEVLDISDNSLTGLTATCVDYNVTSVFGSNSTSGLLSATTDPAAGRCRHYSEMSDSRALSLRVFNASWNQIDAIEVGLFDRKSGRRLELLDLSFNRVGRLDNGTFVDLYALRCVNLSHNVITDIEVDAFTMTSDEEQADAAADVGYQATGKQREEQYYISLASCTRGWPSIQVLYYTYYYYCHCMYVTVEKGLKTTD